MKSLREIYSNSRLSYRVWKFRSRLSNIAWWFRSGCPAVFTSCKNCRAWSNWRYGHACSDGENCRFSGLCCVCIDTIESEELKQREIEDAQTEAFQSWLLLYRDDPNPFDDEPDYDVDPDHTRCKKCNAWSNWGYLHACSDGENCRFSGLCCACIDTIEIEELKQREIEDAQTEALNEEIMRHHAEAAPFCECCETQMRLVEDDDVDPDHSKRGR